MLSCRAPVVRCTAVSPASISITNILIYQEISHGTAIIKELLRGGQCLQLLPGAPYSARDPVQSQSIGVSLQRQQGVHAIGSDRRVDFDTRPGVLACTPAGSMFFRICHGGEYLLMRLDQQFAR